ncbi:CocE/NonD family hydrolase [Schlegelella sp. S2-27]|uniref:CocE/NonD family hydrolase n=1 Tax=Caldimonas mangrovi TaxID=2944811 RepID=A0ABT0YPW6_9BURK|nr:CocE/NonD family hydrolase [Caldimonas mangrovi]MCM5680176.1 CocE/NonD family hydrolase [Caldimonas mangrovi]
MMQTGFGVLRVADVMVPMRDGVRLATDVYRPALDGVAVDGVFPVILERTPYGKTEPSRAEVDRGARQPYSRHQLAAYYVEQGYVVVYQDCRGRHGSQGRFEKYLREADDGEDTLHWLTKQAWCNGRVGTMGLSYAAHTQLALATKAPPGLQTFVLDCGGFSDAYQCGIRQGGAFEMKQATWAVQQAKEALRGDPVMSKALENEDLHAWFKALPWRKRHSPLRWAPEYERYLFEQWANTDFGDYWRQPGLYAKGAYARIPAVPQVHMSGWYDVYVRSTLENFIGLESRSPCARLIMGPWLHGDRNITHAGDVEFGPQASFDANVAESWRAYRRQWFDRWLKGVNNGIDDQPKVLLFLMGGGSGCRNAAGRLEHGGTWVGADAWPLLAARPTPFYLRSDHTLATDASEPASHQFTYDFDPMRPVPTIGGALTSGKPIFEGGAFDQREGERFFGCHAIGLPLSARPDVVVFETPPLPSDMAVVGPVAAHLFVSSNCVDTDFTIKLIDVHPPTSDYPQGFAMNLTDGILRCRYRKSWDHPQPMVAGEVCEIRVEAFATANLFKAGHRIRLDISSSNFPKYDVNPNTGENAVDARRCQVAANTVHIGPRYPSRLVLPLVHPHQLQPWSRP